MNSGSIKYKGGANVPPKDYDGSVPNIQALPVTMEAVLPAGKHVAILDEKKLHVPKNKEYVTRILYTGAAIEDVRRRIAAVFSELCPSGWSYHSTININSGEVLMVFERGVL